jgi:hypothetical protein
MRRETAVRLLAPMLLISAPLAPVGAVELGDGDGQVLIHPYYTVNAGHSTLLQVHNSRPRAKALKVRILEGSNGRMALSFNLYLGAGETWAAALVADEERGARILSASPACTVPIIAEAGQPLLTFMYQGPGLGDGGSGSVARLREGHVEVIEMGEIQPETDAATAVVQGDCGTLVQAWTYSGFWRASPERDLAAPSGGLQGDASLVDVRQGVMYRISPVALDAFSGIVQHTLPSDDAPSLAGAAGDSAEADVPARWRSSDGTWISAHWPRAQAVDAVSAVLSQSSLSGSFNRDPALGAQTEWVLSFPTKPYYTDTSASGWVRSPLPPFRRGLLPADSPLQNAEVRGGSCSLLPLQTFDRSGLRSNALDPDLCIPLDPHCGQARAAACHVTQVLDFSDVWERGQASGLVGSLRAVPVGPNLGLAQSSEQLQRLLRAPHGGFELGRARLRLEGSLRPSIEGVVPEGLPVIGVALERVIHQNAQPGRVANYGAALPLVGRASVQAAGNDVP